MSDPVFFARKGPFRIAEIAGWTGASVDDAAGAREIRDVAPLDRAGPTDISSMHNAGYLEEFQATGAGAVLVHPQFAGKAPAGTLLLEVKQPQAAFAAVVARFYPDAVRPLGAWGGTPRGGQESGANVHPDARLEDGVTVEPGASIGANAEIGAGSVICAGAVVGAQVRIGRDCMVGPGASVICALVGNRVHIHGGVRIGQDGFGYASGASGHLKVPQIGRVIIQDDVEIGANSCIDRGALKDTVIGEGTKIDNLVQIGHNVTVGRHCVIVALAGISGSVTLGDNVVIGGQAGFVGHVSIGDGAQIAAHAGVTSDVPAGGRWGGAPAKPMREFARELVAIKRLGRSAGGPDRK